jgi:hypothetical protein
LDIDEPNQFLGTECLTDFCDCLLFRVIESRLGAENNGFQTGFRLRKHLPKHVQRIITSPTRPNNLVAAGEPAHDQERIPFF